MGHLIELWGSLGYSGQLALMLGLGMIGILVIASLFVPEAALTKEEQAILDRPRRPTPPSNWLPWAFYPAIAYAGVLGITGHHEGPPKTVVDKFWVAFLWLIVGVIGLVLLVAEPLYYLLKVAVTVVAWFFAFLFLGGKTWNDVFGRRKGANDWPW